MVAEMLFGLLLLAAALLLTTLTTFSISKFSRRI